MESTTADRAQIATFQNQATEAANRLNAMLTGLMNRLSTLQGYWVGSGGSAFTMTKMTVEDQQQRLNRALVGIGVDVGIAGRHYEAGDTEQGSEMRQANAAATDLTAKLIPSSSV